MRRTAVLPGLALCLLAMAAFAAENPNIGTWKLNEGKSKMSAGASKNTTVVYAADGDNMKVTTDGVTGDGSPAHSEWVGKFDGKDYPVTGDPAIDTRSYNKINERTMLTTNKKGGKVVSTGHIEVARDGKTRTLTLERMTDGKKVKSTYEYDKE